MVVAETNKSLPTLALVYLKRCQDYAKLENTHHTGIILHRLLFIDRSSVTQRTSVFCNITMHAKMAFSCKFIQ